MDNSLVSLLTLSPPIALGKCTVRTGHTQDYHFHQKLVCLFDAAASGHSTKVGETVDGGFIYGKFENTNEEPLRDACGGHYGFTPESPTVAVYHYHVQDAAPFTVGCFGPNDDGSMVTVQECRNFYSECDGVLDTLITKAGTISYDYDCPCWDAAGSNTGINIAELAAFSTTDAPTVPPATTGAPAVVTSTTVSPTGRKNCATLGWNVLGNICAESNDGWACKTDATYAEAETTCAAVGARVCTIEEIETGVTAQTGCNMDTEYVWSSTWCGLGPKYYCGMGSGTGERKCKKYKKAKSIRCCSDVSVAADAVTAVTTTTTYAPEPRKNCATLGWPVVGSACGESDLAFKIKFGTDKCYNWLSQPDGEKQCARLGGRLCSHAELAGGVGQSTGCSFDSKFVWTSTACATGYVKAKANAAATGSPTFSSSLTTAVGT